MSAITCGCEWCSKPFQTRTQDRARGWGRFCSKRCKAMHQEKRTHQNAAFQHESEQRQFDRDMESAHSTHGQDIGEGF